jgi:polyhydroxybutyrate depolymerase
MKCLRRSICAVLLAMGACAEGFGMANNEPLGGASGTSQPTAGSAGTAPPTNMAMGSSPPPSPIDAGATGGIGGSGGGLGGVGGQGGSGGDHDDRDAAIAGSDATTPIGMGEYQALTVDGLAVTVYLPALRPGAPPAPVVFSLHGLSIPSLLMPDITGLPAIADEAGFIGVFPEGTGGSWNTGGAACGLGSFVSSGADDVTYLLHILDAVEALRAIDRTRVFVSGFSMGGYGTNALGCTRPDLFRALAPAAGGMAIGPCATGAIPVMIFHGTADGTIGYDCGVQARDAWVAHNGCSSQVDKVPVMGGTCKWNVGCPPHAQVVLCTFDGMGHGWAGSINPFAFGGLEFESATGLMWRFFEEYL